MSPCRAAQTQPARAPVCKRQGHTSTSRHHFFLKNLRRKKKCRSADVEEGRSDAPAMAPAHAQGWRARGSQGQRADGSLLASCGTTSQSSRRAPRCTTTRCVPPGDIAIREPVCLRPVRCARTARFACRWSREIDPCPAPAVPAEPPSPPAAHGCRARSATSSCGCAWGQPTDGAVATLGCRSCRPCRQR
jgi:hypothetical protein